VGARNHPLVIRKLSVDQLGGKQHAVEPEAGLAAREFDRHGIVAVLEQLGELQDGLAGDDHLLLAQVARGELARCDRKPMPVGRDDAQLARVDHYQQAVQVVPNVLLRHRVLHEREHGFQLALRQLECHWRPLRRSQPGKVLGRQRLELETALAAAHLQALVRERHRDLAAFGQRAQDVEQLAGADRHRLGLPGGLRSRGCADLDLDVGRDERESVVHTRDEDVREDRQRVAPLDDPGNRLQRFEQGLAACLH
jgi:hypothetical protein